MKTSRRTLFRMAGIGGFAAGLGLVGRNTSIVSSAQAQTAQDNPRVLSHATVAFGAWRGDEGWDRTDPSFNPILANDHTVAPRDVTIKAGGSVSYLLAGFHQIIVYDNGTEPDDIDASNLVFSQGPGAPPFPILIDDPARRIFRGADPGGQPIDRIENVHFAAPGRYLVICGVVFHFVNDGMYGFVNVLP